MQAYVYLQTHVYICGYLCICLHTHNLQNEELNKQGEHFKENVIFKFHIYHEQQHERPEDKELNNIVENYIVHVS